MQDEQEKVPEGIVKPNLFEIVAFLGIAVALGLFLMSVASVIQIPYGLDFGEGYLADMSFNLVAGINPWHSLDEPPWVVSSYPPLYPIINGILMHITGPSLVPGRILSAVSLLGIFAMSILIFRRFSVYISVAILSAGLLFCFEWGFRWAHVVRVDTFGIFLASCGIYFWIRSDRPVDGIISAIFLLLSVLTKHSLLAAPVAVILHAVFSKDRRWPMMLGLIVVGIAGSYGIVNFITSGGFFKHLFGYTANAWFVERFIDITLYIRATWLLHVVAISAYLIPGVLKGKRAIFGWYYLLGHGNLLAYGFEGSDTNYFIEPLLATLLISGFTLNHLVRAKHETGMRLPSAKTIAYGIIVAIIIIGRFSDPSGYRIHRTSPDRVDPGQIENGKTLIGWATDAPGLVLFEDASYTFLAGKEVVFQPYIMSLLQRTGKWDQEPFLETIRNRVYSMIVLRVDLADPYSYERQGGLYEMAGFDRWTDEMEVAIDENYTLFNPNGQPIDVGIWNNWYVYFPKDLIEEISE